MVKRNNYHLPAIMSKDNFPPVNTVNYQIDNIKIHLSKTKKNIYAIKFSKILQINQCKYTTYLDTISQASMSQKIFKSKPSLTEST